MHKVLGGLYVVFMCSVLQLQAAVPLVQIGSGPPLVVDGQLDDAGWEHCARVFPFVENMGKGLARAQTEVLLYYDADALYLAFQCDEPHVGNLVADHTVRDHDVWRDDCVEIFIQIPNDITVYHILVNSQGLTSDAKAGNYGWDPRLDIAPLRSSEPNLWGVEMAIPWSEFGTAPKLGDVWNINFTRQRKVEFERSAWNATYGTFNNAARFGAVVFAAAPVVQQVLEVSPPVLGANHARVQLRLPQQTVAQLSGEGGLALEIADMDEPVDLMYPLGLGGDEVVLTAQTDRGPIWQAVFPGPAGDAPAVGRIRRAIDALKETPSRLDSAHPLREKLVAALAQAQEAEGDLRRAIERSVEQDRALPVETFGALNDAVKREAEALHRMRWVLWTKNNWANVGRREFPAGFEGLEEVELTSVINEYEHANIIISNLANEPLRLHAGLTDYQWLHEGETITFAGVRVELAVADWQDVVKGQTVADPLLPLGRAGRLDIPAGESRQLWLTLPARDLPPGRYECLLSLNPIGDERIRGSFPGKTVRIALDIQPLRISTSPDFAVYNWDYAGDEAYARDLYEHKVNRFLVGTGIPTPEFDRQGNALTDIDYTGYDRLLRLKMKYADKANGQILFAYGILESFHETIGKKYSFEYRSPAWDKAFRFAYTHWLAHLKALGLDYDDFCVQVWDEALLEELDYTVAGCKLLREIDPRVRLVMDGCQTIEDIKRIDPYIDVWIPSLDHLLKSKDRELLLATYHSLGEPVYCYTCYTNMKSQSPYDYHRLKPWQAAHLNMEGVFYWAYNSWRGDPWNDYDGPTSNGTFYADCGVVYSGLGGPVTSRRWEASRQGIEDWQIIRMAQKLAAGREDAENILGQIDEAIREVIQNPSRLDLASKHRLDIIRVAVQLAADEPLQVVDVRSKTVKRRLKVTFKTNRRAMPKLFYRLLGTDNWLMQELPYARKHRAEVVLPPEAKADWLILAWDGEGRVAFKKHAGD